MACTPAEIEEKRRQAQMKLLLKSKSNPSHQISSPMKGTFSSPLKRSHLKPYEKTNSPKKFYGTSTTVTVTFSLISEDRFSAKLSVYNERCITIFKSIPTNRYNLETKSWEFHIKDHDLLESNLYWLRPEITTIKLPSFVIKACNITKGDYDNFDLSKIDDKLLNTLMEFQREGVCFGIEKNGRCLIADEMGLGKTYQALGIASYFREDWPLLIVTTASMKNIWEQTIHDYLPSVSIMETQYMTSGRDYIGDAKVVIASHDMMQRSVEKLLNRNFGVIIIDESHSIKNFKAKCTQAAISLAKKSKRIVLLSGTPALSRPKELYSQLNLIAPNFFGNFYSFAQRYCDAKESPFGWDASGKSNLKELEIVLSKKFMIRRTKSEVLESLPNKLQEVINLDVGLDRMGEEDRKTIAELLTQYDRSKAREKHSALLTYFSETSRIKIPSVCSYISNVLATDLKFLVFAHHQIMLDAIEQVVRKRGKNFIRIDGSTTSEQRKFFIDKFQHNDSYICAILSITAANAGITLTSAQLIIFAELHWNPSILSQAESRAHRIGQKDQVTVRYLLARGTADDKIWPMLKEKQKTLGEIGLTEDSYDDVTIKDQASPRKTLDISTYFEPSEKMENASFEEIDLFNDGFDELLGAIDI